MDINKIKILANEKNISLKEICLKIGISEQGFHKMFKTNSIKVDILEKIASVLGVHVNYFFDKDYSVKNLNIITAGHKINGNQNNINGDISINEAKREIIHLRELLAEREKRINAYEDELKYARSYFERLIKLKEE